MQGIHVDLINVGTFFAVDLDIDEKLVHHPRGRLILKRFMCHNVAPVTGGVTDRQQYWLIGTLGLVQRFGSP
jgi:hypothetical protein